MISLDTLTIHWGWGAFGGVVAALSFLFISPGNPFLVMGMFSFGVVIGAVGPKGQFLRGLWQRIARRRSRALKPFD